MNIEQILKEKAPLIDKAIEKYIPRKFSKDSILFKLNQLSPSYNFEPLNKAVSEPVWEFLDRGGKRWRPTLFLLVCEALDQNPEKLVEYSIIPEVVHNGTLMIDDIEDSSEMRRGKPSTYRLFGVDIAINAGNTMYYLPLLTLLRNRRKIPCETLRKTYEIYTEEMISVSIGQAMDIAWHRGIASADEITEDDYLKMCACKTGALARMAARMAATFSEANEQTVEKLGGFAENVGVAFQIRDDVLDLTSEEFEQKKGGRGQDITEGKRSLIVIHTLKTANAKDRKRLLDILAKHTSDQKLKDEAIFIMEKTGSIEYARQKARKMVINSWSHVEKLLKPSEAKEKLKAFAEFLIERKI